MGWRSFTSYDAVRPGHEEAVEEIRRDFLRRAGQQDLLGPTDEDLEALA
jgi:hypothetical protein